MRTGEPVKHNRTNAGSADMVQRNHSKARGRALLDNSQPTRRVRVQSQKRGGKGVCVVRERVGRAAMGAIWAGRSGRVRVAARGPLGLGDIQIALTFGKTLPAALNTLASGPGRSRPVRSIPYC